MNVRQKSNGADAPGSDPRVLRSLAASSWIFLAVLALLSAATPAEATSALGNTTYRGITPDSVRPSPAAIAIRSAPAARTSTWQWIRDELNRILEPDVRILRYTTRYAISQDLAAKIVETATAEGIDPDLAFRLVRVESRFHPRARSHAGALGLTQLMPGTARLLDRSLRTEADILDPDTNLTLGFRYLRTMIEKYQGDVRLALLAYNRGPGAVDRSLRMGRDPENGYSYKVLGTGLNRYQGHGVLR